MIKCADPVKEARAEVHCLGHSEEGILIPVCRRPFQNLERESYPFLFFVLFDYVGN